MTKKRKTVRRVAAALKRYVQRKRNPAKAVRLKNFTGTVRVNPRTKVTTVTGRQKRAKKR